MVIQLKKIFGLLFAAVPSALNCVAQPVIVSQPANQTVALGGDAAFSVMVTGLGPLSCQRQLNGTNLPNHIITTVAGGKFPSGIAATNSALVGSEGTGKQPTRSGGVS